jgi:thiol:disulfide interchange protein DsbC
MSLPSGLTPLPSSRLVLALCMLAASLLAPAALADEATIRSAFEAKFPKAKIESLRPLAYGGLWEIIAAGAPVLYTDAKFTFLIQGTLIDMKTGVNVTAQRQQQLEEQRQGPIDFASLPLDLAVRKVRGNGKRTLVTFEDPNCGFCQKLSVELARLDNVTIYTFLYPILSADSIAKSRGVWCSSDRAAAWEALMLKGTVPAGKADCETPIDRTLALGAKLNVDGTPTLFLADGRRLIGLIPAARLDQLLDSVKR